jgi:hypothetical protein
MSNVRQHKVRLFFAVAVAAVAGPLLAFLVLFIGCGGSSPGLGTMCGHNTPVSLVALTLLAWLLLAVAATVIRMARSDL